MILVSRFLLRFYIPKHAIYVAMLTVSLASASSSAAVEVAGIEGEHGVGATKGCTPRCIGDTTDCTATVQYLDDFDDAIVVTEAWDEVHAFAGIVRVPTIGNLPIISVIGNAFCTSQGGACDSMTGANCILPCTIGSSESVVGGLPGLSGYGRVRFAQNEYVIQPEDVGSLADTVRFTWSDFCNSGESSCPQGELTTPAGSGTIVPECDDGALCTTDTCLAGVCSNIPDCTSNEECDDGDICTTEMCIDGCCTSEPTGNDFDGDGLVDICDPDIDNDGVVNDPDACDFTSVGSDVDATGRPLGDIDMDCDTDLDDYELFRQGFTGAALKLP